MLCSLIFILERSEGKFASRLFAVETRFTHRSLEVVRLLRTSSLLMHDYTAYVLFFSKESQALPFSLPLLLSLHFAITSRQLAKKKKGHSVIAKSRGVESVK